MNGVAGASEESPPATDVNDGLLAQAISIISIVRVIRVMVI